MLHIPRHRRRSRFFMWILQSVCSRQSAAKAAGQPGEQTSPDVAQNDPTPWASDDPDVYKWVLGFIDLKKREQKEALHRLGILAEILKLALPTQSTVSDPSDPSLDHIATLFAGLTPVQQNDVLDRADRMRDAAQAQEPAEAG